jgi:hypothetical protein
VGGRALSGDQARRALREIVREIVACGLCLAGGVGLSVCVLCSVARVCFMTPQTAGGLPGCGLWKQSNRQTVVRRTSKGQA